jgi:hypothetical protein
LIISFPPAYGGGKRRDFNYFETRPEKCLLLIILFPLARGAVAIEFTFLTKFKTKIPEKRVFGAFGYRF